MKKRKPKPTKPWEDTSVTHPHHGIHWHEHELPALHVTMDDSRCNIFPKKQATEGSMHYGSLWERSKEVHGK